MVKHLACIMDGNRRFALQHKLGLESGYKKGRESLMLVIDFCLQNAISYLTVYAFSLENFKRSPQEVAYFFDFFMQTLVDKLIFLQQHGIRVRFYGDKSVYPEKFKKLCEHVEKETADATRLYLSILVCYGSQQEIVDATKSIVQQVVEGSVVAADITTELFSQCLWTKDIPFPDLIIRTGKDRRLSNFLLFQAAYSEIYFLDCLWPELTQNDLSDAVEFFNRRRCNYGL